MTRGLLTSLKKLLSRNISIYVCVYCALAFNIAIFRKKFNVQGIVFLLVRPMFYVIIHYGISPVSLHINI